jgi:hypothetical protein
MSLSSVLSSPAGALAELYSSEEHSSIDAFPAAVSKHFSDVFKKHEDLDKVSAYKDKCTIHVNMPYRSQCWT